ncbi:MAG TPA: YciI family protein [Caulobacteraceae bacterium]|jgi:uncharacterized protein YciI|nr:YciI family protein [Caulobacteraceae bacterium]
MLYLLKATFKPGVEAQRHAIHDAFSAHIAQSHPRVRLGGSLQDEAGGRVGVLIILEADDRAQAERFVASSPYTKAGLYARTEIERLDLEVGTLG